jgi:hypothetical protein
MLDLIPAAFFGGVVAFVGGIWGSVAGLPASDTARYSRRTARIFHLALALVGAAVACAAWPFVR